MDYTEIIKAIIALITALVSAFFIPWLKAKIDAETLKKISTYVDIAVSSGADLYRSGRRRKESLCAEISGRQGHSV